MKFFLTDIVFVINCILVLSISHYVRQIWAVKHIWKFPPNLNPHAVNIASGWLMTGQKTNFVPFFFLLTWFSFKQTNHTVALTEFI